MATYEVKNMGVCSTAAGKVQNSVLSLGDNIYSIEYILNEIGEIWEQSGVDAKSAHDTLVTHVEQLRQMSEACEQFGRGVNAYIHALEQTSSNTI